MDLKSMTMEELTDCIVELGEKKFRAKQIYGWLHQKLVRRPEEMSNVPAKCLEKLLKEHPFYGVEEVRLYFFTGRLPYGLPFLCIYVTWIVKKLISIRNA